MKVPVLASGYVRGLVQAECAAVRDGAARVVATAHKEGPEDQGSLDTEAIHDYRVALRRLRTLLRAAAPLFKRGPMERLFDGLRRFARAAGAVRDEEVLAETLNEITLPARRRDRSATARAPPPARSARGSARSAPARRAVAPCAARPRRAR